MIDWERVYFAQIHCVHSVQFLPTCDRSNSFRALANSRTASYIRAVSVWGLEILKDILDKALLAVLGGVTVFEDRQFFKVKEKRLEEDIQK